MQKLLERIEVVKQLRELEKFTDIEYTLGEFTIMCRVNGNNFILDCDRMNRCKITQERLNFALRLSGVS